MNKRGKKAKGAETALGAAEDAAGTEEAAAGE